MSIWNMHDGFTASKVVYPDGKTYGPRIQQFLQLNYQYEGEITLWIDDRKHRVKHGEMIVLFPGRREYWEFHSKSGRNVQGYCRCPIDGPTPAFLKTLQSIPFKRPFTRVLRNLADRINQLLHDSSEPGKRMFNAYARMLFLEYFQECGYARLSGTPLHPCVQKARTYLEQNIEATFDCAQLARVAGSSPSYITELFRKEMGTTPMRYLWKIRLEKARTLMTETSLSLSEIASQCGFQNPFHFSRLFKQQYGKSPKQSRTRQT